MAPVHPILRQRLIRQMVEIQKDRAIHFPYFLAAAKEVMPDRVAEPRFEFVVCRLLQDRDDGPEPGFESRLRERYDKFVSKFEWTVDGAPAWVNETRIATTLSFWQKRHPSRLRAVDAVGILRRLREALAPRGVFA